MIILNVQYYISVSCLLGWILPLETQYPWEMLRVGNHGAWVHKMIGGMTEVGFHQRIFVQVKHLIPALAGYTSPYINVEWMLSHSKVRWINHISFTFRLSLKKKWTNVHISKPGLRYFCCYCAARPKCRLPDIEKGWLYLSFQADKVTSSSHFIYLFVLLALNFQRFYTHCFRTKRTVMTNMVVMFHLIPRGIFFFQWWASAPSHVEIWLTKHDLWLAYFRNCFLLQALLRA